MKITFDYTGRATFELDGSYRTLSPTQTEEFLFGMHNAAVSDVKRWDIIIRKYWDNALHAYPPRRIAIGDLFGNTLTLSDMTMLCDLFKCRPNDLDMRLC